MRCIDTKVTDKVADLYEPSQLDVLLALPSSLISCDFAGALCPLWSCFYLCCDF